MLERKPDPGIKLHTTGIIVKALRWPYDHLQMDWPFDLLLHSAPLRWAAEQMCSTGVLRNRQ